MLRGNPKGRTGLASIRNWGHGDPRFSLMPGISKMFDSGQGTLTSLHKFGPLPVEVMGGFRQICYQLSDVFRGTRSGRKTDFSNNGFAENDWADNRLWCWPFLGRGGKMRQLPIRLIKMTESRGSISLRRIRTELKLKAVGKRRERTSTCSFAARVKDWPSAACLSQRASKNVQDSPLEKPGAYEEIPKRTRVAELGWGN